MIWEVDERAQKRINDIARAVKGADKLILATDPDREGEAISWHVLEVLKEKNALKDQDNRAGGVQRHHQAGGHRCDEASAQDRPCAGRCLSRAPRARLSRRLHALAGAVAQIAGRALGRPRAVGRACGWSATANSRSRNSSRANIGRWSRRSRRRATISFEARLVGADGSKITRLDIGSGQEAEDFKKALETAAFTVVVGRGQAGAAQSPAPLHHLDPAAGSQPQARLRARPHHAHRAAAL